LEKEQLYSEEAGNVMYEIPSWITKWCKFIILFIVASLFIISYYVACPQTTTVSFTLPCNYFNNDVIIKENNILIGFLLDQDDDYVKKGQVVKINLTSNHAELIFLKGKVKSIDLLTETNFKGDYVCEILIETKSSSMSNYLKCVNISEEIKGTAEISIDAVRLFRTYFKFY